jgi:hypothetical protein
MAKAVLPLAEFVGGAGDPPTGRACQERVIQRFLRALSPGGKGDRQGGA